jgi:hypothetical protein
MPARRPELGRRLRSRLPSLTYPHLNVLHLGAIDGSALGEKATQALSLHAARDDFTFRRSLQIPGFLPSALMDPRRPWRAGRALQHLPRLIWTSLNLRRVCSCPAAIHARVSAENDRIDNVLLECIIALQLCIARRYMVRPCPAGVRLSCRSCSSTGLRTRDWRQCCMKLPRFISCLVSFSVRLRSVRFSRS